jgi:hypothetical protein
VPGAAQGPQARRFLFVRADRFTLAGVTKINLKDKTHIEVIATPVRSTEKTDILGADYPAIVLQWSVRAGMARSTGTRRVSARSRRPRCLNP